MTALNDVAVARMTAVGAPRVYALGAVPESPPYPYSVISSTIGDPVAYNMAAQYGAKRHRLTVQAFGHTANEVIRTLERAESAFLDQSLTDFDPDATPCIRDLATAPERDPDDNGVIYAVSVYAFTTS